MPAALHACPNCGIELPAASLEQQSNIPIPLPAQQQIEDLQAQVRLLTEKATAAVDKWADYEDELQRLRAQSSAANRTSTPPNSAHDSPTQNILTSPFRPSFPSVQIQNRLSSFLSPRKSAPNLNLNPPPPSPSELSLMAELQKEQVLRQAAEKKLDEGSGELEELSSQLFQQANEMVAAERKARAKLEARVEVLEKRDGEKRKRLEKLENAMQRIERVRGLLAPPVR